MIVHFVVQGGMMLIFKPLMLKLGLEVSRPLPTWYDDVIRGEGVVVGDER